MALARSVRVSRFMARIGGRSPLHIMKTTWSILLVLLVLVAAAAVQGQYF
jgi:hypothetical protein